MNHTLLLETQVRDLKWVYRMPEHPYIQGSMCDIADSQVLHIRIFIDLILIFLLISQQMYCFLCSYKIPLRHNSMSFIFPLNSRMEFD